VNYVHRNPVKRGLVELETQWVWSSAREYAALRDFAVGQDVITIGELPGRAGVPIDTIHIDRYDFPEQSLASLWIDGKPCLEIE